MHTERPYTINIQPETRSHTARWLQCSGYYGSRVSLFFHSNALLFYLQVHATAYNYDSVTACFDGFDKLFFSRSTLSPPDCCWRSVVTVVRTAGCVVSTSLLYSGPQKQNPFTRFDHRMGLLNLFDEFYGRTKHNGPMTFFTMLFLLCWPWSICPNKSYIRKLF